MRGELWPVQVREWAAAIVPELANVGLDRVSLTSYPYPRDGHPIIGFTEAASNCVYCCDAQWGNSWAPGGAIGSC